jgi:hypothetical protein
VIQAWPASQARARALENTELSQNNDNGRTS